MIQLTRWKVLLVLLATVFAIVFSLPNLLPQSVTARWPAWASQRLNLGLDLQGGSYLLLEVDIEDLRRQTLANLLEDVRRTLQERRIQFSGLGQADGAVQVQITDPAQAQAAQQELGRLPQPLAGAAGGMDMTVTRAGQQITLRPVAEAHETAATRAVEQSIEIIRRRVDELGTREPTIVRQGTNRIVVQAPGESDPERLKRIIGQTAQLNFHMVDETVTPDQAAVGRVPPGSMVLPSEEGAPIAVQRRALVSGDMLIMARPAFDQFGRSVVEFRFNAQGARRFGDATRQNVGRRFAIVLDERVISAPVINEPITGGSGQISGNFTPETANDLAVLLRAGALPARLNIEQEQTVGAELGADAIQAGTISTVLGLICVVIFMVAVYGLLFGGVSIVGMALNGLLIIAVMSVTQATLTLPGVVGLILTLAVAVDANVLIYERMRDEMREGRQAIAAMESGFSRAMGTILDANITTILAALIMFQFGSGPVRGFAWTLSIGVVTTVFTAVFVTQVLLGWWFKQARPKSLPIV